MYGFAITILLRIGDQDAVDAVEAYKLVELFSVDIDYSVYKGVANDAMRSCLGLPGLEDYKGEAHGCGGCGTAVIK